MPKRPLIAMSSSYRGDNTIALRHTYFDAIYDAGGIPVPLERTADPATVARYAADFDGFFFTGGADIDPLYYGEEASADCGEIQPYRDSLEFSMLDEVLRAKKPILAVCRGAQLVNVAFGGTLYQDIHNEYKTDISHRQAEPLLSHSHEVEISDGTPLKELFGENRARVNSFHHQTIKRLADGLKESARSEDGIVEAVYGEERFIRGYQWHPELLFAKDSVSQKLFEEFVLACVKE